MSLPGAKLSLIRGYRMPCSYRKTVEFAIITHLNHSNLFEIRFSLFGYTLAN